MSKEESPSVADIAMKYAGLVSQAAANKAAEEGGLLHEIKEFLGDMHAMPVEWTIAQSQVLCAKVSDAIAADRASRQVANKAEQETRAAYRDRPTYDEKVSIGSRDFFEMLIEYGKEPSLSKRMEIADFIDSHIDNLVANKAEVEVSDSYKAGYADGMEEGAKLAFWGDKPSEKFPEGWPAEIWLNAGDDELGPFSEYDEVSWCSAPQGESDIRYIREDLLATPPATTGASTVRDQALEEAAALVEGCDKRASLRGISIAIRALKGSVGASTVLTDERIEEIAGLECDEEDRGFKFNRLGKYSVISFARAIAREVAAQAGQVAVPGWTSADDRQPEFRHECTSSGCKVSDSLMVYGQNEFGTTGCGFGHARDDGTWATYEAEYDQLTVVKVTHWMPLPAAPSPAKESK